MRDPRLAELECLIRLEREGPLDIEVPKNATIEMFGLGATPLREMFAELIEQGFVNGNATAMDRDWVGGASRDLAGEVRRDDLINLAKGHPIRLRIGHKGRIQLWNLRDQLRADRDRDQFGILYDRRAWERELAVQLPFASADNPFSILYMDLDYFKSVNEKRGHAGGDEVLKGSFIIMRDLTGDRAYRWGGEEVAASLPGVDSQKAREIASAIRAKVEAAFAKEDPPTTVSIGLATFTSFPVTPEEAFSCVDRLLMSVKRSGRNRVEVEQFVRIST
jgi:diguanylate cyclase (GGDEF)-like protein